MPDLRSVGFEMSECVVDNSITSASLTGECDDIKTLGPAWRIVTQRVTARLTVAAM